MCKCRVEGLVIKAEIEKIPTPTPAMVGDWYDWSCSILGCPKDDIEKYHDCNLLADHCAPESTCAWGSLDPSTGHDTGIYRWQCIPESDWDA